MEVAPDSLVGASRLASCYCYLASRYWRRRGVHYMPGAAHATWWAHHAGSSGRTGDELTGIFPAIVMTCRAAKLYFRICAKYGIYIYIFIQTNCTAIAIVHICGIHNGAGHVKSLGQMSSRSSGS